MARKLISGNDILDFNPSTGVINLKGYVPLDKLLLINNTTRNINLFNFTDPGLPATATYNSINNTTSIDVSYDASAMSASDVIQVYYEKDEIEIKPSTTYKDPVSKFRVSNPQTLIDTDFEYSPQPTKWETLKLVNNVPTSYSSPFTENSILVDSITVTEGSNIMNIVASNNFQLSSGGVVEITGLTDPQFEGTFIVVSSTENSFSIKLPFNSPKSATLNTIYSIVYKGAFYTGSLIQANDVATTTGTASTIVVTTPNIHGFQENTKLYLKNTRATKKYTITAPDDVVGSGVTEFRSTVTGLGGNGETDYYSVPKIIADDFVGFTEYPIDASGINYDNAGTNKIVKSNLINQAALSSISVNDILIYYTPEGNTGIADVVNSLQVTVPNFKPLLVTQVSETSTEINFKCKYADNDPDNIIFDGSGTNLYGSHRFIKGFRVIGQASPNKIYLDINFNEILDNFSIGDTIILNVGNIVGGGNDDPNTTPLYNSSSATLNGLRFANYYGQLNANYYIYKISGLNPTEGSLTLEQDTSYGNYSRSVTPAFSNLVNGPTAYQNQNDILISCAKIERHPLANSIYLPSDVGFSTSRYDDYQIVNYTASSTAATLPGFLSNNSYLVKRISDLKPDFYRIYKNEGNENNSDTAANWTNPIDIYYNSSGSGTAINVTNGSQIFSSNKNIDNSNTIKITDRGGLENNAIVVYNTAGGINGAAQEIGGLELNASYKVKTEDTSLDSDSFRLSESSQTTRLYGVSYTRNTNTASFYVYDLIDRPAADLSADDGIKSAGIEIGNTIQISGCEYPNPIKNNFINNSFEVSGISNYSTSLPGSAQNLRRYIYKVDVIIPTNNTINRKTTISLFDDDSILGNTKVNSIQVLTLDPLGATDGDSIFSQNINGAIDDIYETKNVGQRTFEFNTQIEIPKVTKNITLTGSTTTPTQNITFTSTQSNVVIENNGTANAGGRLNFVGSTTVYQGAYSTLLSGTGTTGSFAIEFKFRSTTPGFVEAGIFESQNLSQVSSLSNNQTFNPGGFAKFRQAKYNSTSPFYQPSIVTNDVYGGGTQTYSTDQNLVDDTTAIYRIEYDEQNGTLSYSRNGSVIRTSTPGSGKSYYPFFRIYNSTQYNSIFDGVKDFSVVGTDTVTFTPGQEFLKIGAHNFADGTPVTYSSSNPSDLLDPLLQNQTYYTRVLDGDFIGLSETLEGALDRNSPLIGINTTGNGATQSLETFSVNGFLTGEGSVAITSTTDLVRGTNTSFLSDFSIGETFRVYRSANSEPGDYFESKIVSIKNDNVIKLENIPTYTSEATNYFKQTGLFAVSDGKITHRPFDGGVAMNTGLIPNTKVVRQTRKYFRYQSGKGIQVSMAINFNPVNDIDLITPVGTGSTTYYNIRSKFAHKLPAESVSSDQRVIISDVHGPSESFFNRLSTDTGFPIVDVPDEFNFVVEIDEVPTSSEISGFPKYSLKNWGDSAIRAGLFDDQNGFFFEYDGTTLYAVRRSSTQQLSGRFQVQRNSHLIQGIDSLLTKQLSKNDSIVVRGQTYKVVSIASDSSISVQPAYRGNSSNDIVISKVIDTKVSQSNWSLDRMDATGISGYKIDISKIQMIYMDYSWYGAGSIRFGFKDQHGDVRYAHEFIHNNIFTESYFRSGNIPARYEVETFDNPLYSPALNHWGVSVIMDGRYDDDKAYLFTADSEPLSFTNSGYTSIFEGDITEGSFNIDDIPTGSFDYSQLVVGSRLVQATSSTNSTPVTGNLDPEARIAKVEIYTQSSFRNGSTPRYRIIMDKAALSSVTNGSFYAFSGTSEDLQNLIPLVSIRLAPSVDNGNIGNLGFRDIINRMQLTLKTAGVLVTHDCEVQLILNGKLSDDNYDAVTSPSLSQIYKHEVGDRIVEGIKVYSFRAQGGQLISGSTPVGRRGLNSTDVSLDELALLGNSILGGDATFPDGPDVLTLAVKPIDTSTINGSSPFIVSGKISWAEAQA